MSTLIKTSEVLALIRKGGRWLGQIRDEIAERVKPGISTEELETWAVQRIQAIGGRPSFKDYQPDPSMTPFPTCLCISINNEIVHGPARPARLLKKGDVVGIDIGMQWPAENGYFTDTAVTVAVGEVTQTADDLIRTTRQALAAGIKVAKPGNLISDIGRAVEAVVKPRGYGIVRDLVGHGVGYAVHEEPAFPNYFDRRFKPVTIQEGMVLAIEPMVTLGSATVKTLADGWTIVTQDGSLAAHFEHTVIIGKKGAEIIT